MNPRDSAMLLTMFQSGLDVSTLCSARGVQRGSESLQDLANRLSANALAQREHEKDRRSKIAELEEKYSRLENVLAKLLEAESFKKRVQSKYPIFNLRWKKCIARDSF